MPDHTRIGSLRTFGTMGKELQVLKKEKETELFNHEGRGCLTHFDKEEREFSAYRLHEDDPVFFQDGLRLTNRCGEKIGDKIFHDPPPTRYTTYTWVYEC
jgi:hypothetical protein